MKRKLTKLMSILFAALMVTAFAIPCIPVSAENNVGNTTDFVLLMDCSATMKTNDPNQLCIDACKMFLNLIPEENARVAVIAFGYPDGSSYVYSNANESAFIAMDTDGKLASSGIHEIYDADYVHVISPLADVSVKDNMKSARAAIDGVLAKAEKAKTYTPVGQALLAAIDLLEVKGSIDSQAGIILLSDGVSAPKSAVKGYQNMIDLAIDSAADHEWPIYWIELDYENKNDSLKDSLAPNVALKNLCTKSGAGSDGRRKARSPEDVSAAFLNIFSRFFGSSGNSSTLSIGKDGMVKLDFIVPELTSETTVIVTGNSTEKVVLTNPEGLTTTVKANHTTDNLIATVEAGSYYCLKMLCPESGTWNCCVYGDPNATILVYDNSLQDLSLTLERSQTVGSTASKNEVISFDAYLSYNGTSKRNSSFYVSEAPASLFVQNMSTGLETRFDMTGASDGFHYELPISAVGSGDFRIYAILENGMFRNGRKVSNILSLSSENKPLTWANGSAPETIQMEEYVNSVFEKIDLNNIFMNADGDPITYELNCLSDRSVNFDYQVDSSGYLTIKSGVIPGIYDLEFTASDPDMSEPLAVPLKLSVNDRAIETKSLSKVELWTDAYSFQHSVGRNEEQIDLSEYAIDPDGLPVAITSATTDAEGIIQISTDGSILKLTAEKEGTAKLKLVVGDGVSDAELTLKVKAVSGKAVFWRQNWWKFLGAIVLLAIIIFVASLVSGNTCVKGKWVIHLRKDDEEAVIGDEGPGFDISNHLKIGKKKRFPVKDLLDQMLPLMENGDKFDGVLQDYFTLNYGKTLELVGIVSGKGCKITGIPKNDNVVVYVNGKQATATERLAAGALEIRIKSPESPDDSETLIISMRLK